MPIAFRAAMPADAAAAIPLIYSSGPAAFDYVFTVPGRASALDFLHRAFRDGEGEFGFRNHLVGVVDGAVVAAGAAWDGRSNLAFALAGARQILGCYGFIQGPGTMLRGLQVESIVQPPGRRCWYVAHLGVHPAARSRGIGEALVAHLLSLGIGKGHTQAALDVAVTNPRAEALYQRLGFAVTQERASRLANAQATVPAHRRMVCSIDSGAAGPRAIP
jgi:ribosomal protein S18 acetylase RimI-like enzyme